MSSEAMIDLVQIALAEVGVREEGGNNRGARVREYQEATWLKPDAWPWCAAFTAWCLQQWLLTPVGAAYLGKMSANSWRCRDASAFGWITWAKQRRLQILDERATAKAGDIVVYDFSHIGIVDRDQVAPYIDTVEGNTNGGGMRDSTSGDGVWRKRRQRELVRNYIRLGDRAP